MTKNKSGHNRQTKRTPGHNGEVYLLPSGVFITACCVLHGFNTSQFQKPVAKLLVDGFLSAAHEAGYAGTEILETLIANNDLGHRMREMSREAVEKIPYQVIAGLYKRLGLEYSMRNCPERKKP